MTLDNFYPGVIPYLFLLSETIIILALMEEKLIEYIKNEFLADPAVKIDAETKLISSGLMDSFSLVSLQRFIQTEFGKKIPPPKITAESFDTVKQIMEIIDKY